MYSDIQLVYELIVNMYCQYMRKNKINKFNEYIKLKINSNMTMCMADMSKIYDVQ